MLTTVWVAPLYRPRGRPAVAAAECERALAMAGTGQRGGAEIPDDEGEDCTEEGHVDVVEHL